MSLSASIAAQIRHKAAAIGARTTKRIIGIKTPGRWQGATIDTISGRPYRFAQCDSVLQVREAILEHDAPEHKADDSILVIVTNLDDAALGADALARLARQGLHPLNPWRILQDLFQARSADPQLLNKRWLAEMLLEDVPPEGYPPVGNGLLDAETVWGIALRRRLGINQARPDARDLLLWALDDTANKRFAIAPPELQAALADWIQQSAGHTGEMILEVVKAGRGPDAAAAGLACEVIFKADDGMGERGHAGEAAVRLERLTNNRRVTPETGARWFDASVEVIEIMRREGRAAEVQRTLERVDSVLEEVRADALAHLSRYSPRGFELRLLAFGESLRELLAATQTPSPGSPARPRGLLNDMTAQAQTSLAHVQARDAAERATSVQMAVRLAKWLVETQTHEAGNLAAAANAYARDGGFVDWARQRLPSGEKLDLLARNYKALNGRVTERRERENERFGRLLVEWTAHTSFDDSTLEPRGPEGHRVLPVEDVLRRVVARVAAIRPVLLVVVDGMSWAVFRELIEDITKAGWIEWGTADGALPCPVVAALPSVTEASRASLLCGKLTTGARADETAGFKVHPDLARLSKAQHPPLLFHKGNLIDTGDLSRAVREQIAASEQRLVGVVVNGVDDHLAKGEQVAVAWALKHLPVLKVLMETAAEANRMVILASDHGHIYEHGTVYRRGEPGERYRSANDRPLADELVVEGARVMLPPGDRRHIASWSELVRYGMKKHGYHGGISPQECLVPFAVLSRPDASLDGWKELPLYQPAWWDVTLRARRPTRARAVNAASAKAPPGNLPLFAVPSDVPSDAPGARAETAGWVEALLESPVFRNQSKLLGRAAPPRALVHTFLNALDEAGDTLSRQTLAQRLAQPELRAGETINLMRRLLNVEGYDAISVDEASNTVTLDRELLRREFELQD